MRSIGIFALLCLFVACGEPAQSRGDQLSGLSETATQQQALAEEDYPDYTTFEPEAQKVLFERLAQVRQEKEDNKDMVRMPVFVITCDRISVLIKSLVSFYTRLDTPIEVIIHDNHTTYPPTIEFINQLEKAGLTVVRHHRDVVNEFGLNDLAWTIAKWYETNDSPYYVVTDPDIEIEEDSRDLLTLFSFLLDDNPNAKVVGPMLRYDDLPDHYPFKSYIRDVHMPKEYGRKQLWTIRWNDKPLVVQDGYVDTIFGMYRKTFRFHNYNRGLLCWSPYSARHLDWYIDPENLAADQIYYKRKNSPVGHWSSTFLNK